MWVLTQEMLLLNSDNLDEIRYQAATRQLTAMHHGHIVILMTAPATNTDAVLESFYHLFNETLRSGGVLDMAKMFSAAVPYQPAVSGSPRIDTRGFRS